MATNNAINVGLAGSTGTGSFVGSTSPTLVTPTLGAANATSVNFGVNPLANYSDWADYTPTVTLVGGGGNVVPTFATQSGRWMRIGKTVFVALNFRNAAGGTAGAGTGLLHVALPVTTGASVSALSTSGLGLLATTLVFPCAFEMSPSISTAPLFYINTSTFGSIPVTGGSYAAAARYLQINFSYEVN